MAKLKPFLLDESKPLVVPFSYYGNDVNNIPDSHMGILVDDGGVIKQARWVTKYDKALDLLCPKSDLSTQMCFVKHRADYKEYSVYVPTDSTGTKFIRLYFGNRLNLGNGGFPRLNAGMYATLSGTIGVTDFAQSNVATHVASGSSILDIIIGNGNIEYAVKTRKDSGSLADFVSGIHGKEILDSFSMWIDGVAFSYDSAVVQAKTVCQKVEFEAVCRLGYPSDATNYWMQITYKGTIEKGSYKIEITTQVLKDSDVEIEYAGLIMTAGSLSTQKYAGGIDKFEIGETSYTLNAFDNAIYTRVGFNDASMYNSSTLCCANYPQYGKIVSPYLTNLNASARYTSRTDKFNKAYWQSKDEAWAVLPMGFGLSLDSTFSFRNGDSTSFDWSNNSARKYLYQ